MKGRYIGLLIGIVVISLIPIIYWTSQSYIYNDKDFKIWVSCGSEIYQKYDAQGGSIQGRDFLINEDIYETCGPIPKEKISSFRDSMMRFNNFMFDNPLQYFLWYFGAYFPAIIILLLFFWIGYFFERKAK